MTEETTYGAILEAAREEFLEKGFQDASLRHIVKQAGLTTGAFYGYFKSKEELFDVLVKKPYDDLLTIYKHAQESFKAIPKENQPNEMGKISGDCMLEMLHYMYANLPAFKLILCCSKGTKYTLIDEMVDIEVNSTHDYLEVLKGLGRPSPSIDEHLEHILITGMMNAFFELVIHEMPIEKAENYLAELRAFYTAGWMKIMGQ